MPELGLSNGDVGVLTAQQRDGPQGDWRQSEMAGGLLLFGHVGDSPIWVAPAQLAGACQPALAMTVHKAQGSEADKVILLIPPGYTDQRSLLYTALTRARQHALLVSGKDQIDLIDQA